MKLIYQMCLLFIFVTPQAWANCTVPSMFDDFKNQPGVDVVNSSAYVDSYSILTNKKYYIDGDLEIRKYAEIENVTFYITGTLIVRHHVEIINSLFYSVKKATIKNRTQIKNSHIYSEEQVEYNSTVNWNGHAEACPWVEPRDSYCLNPPDVSDYRLHEGDFYVAKNKTLPVEGRIENLYVTGAVYLDVNARYNGNIYAVGDVYLNNNAVINGDVYSQDGIVLRNVNSDISGETCENGSPVPPPLAPIYLPVDELSEQCSPIFQDAAQSYSSSGHLTMWGNSKIIDDTDKFDFYSHELYGNVNGCGEGVQCTSTGDQSSELSSFTIPTIEAPNIDVALWGDGLDITLGDSGSATDKFKGTAFGDITVYAGGTLTFSSQTPEQVYRINRLNVFGGAAVYLNEGIYAIGGLGVTSETSRIEVEEGDVYLFVSKSDSIQGSIERSNTALPGQFVFAAGETITFNGNARFSGSLYADGNVELNGDTYIEGRIASANLKMSDDAIIENKFICGVTPSEYDFVITTSPEALTCEAQSIGLKVFLGENIDGSYPGTVNLSTDSNKGQWSLLNGRGTLTNTGTSNDGQATYQFHVNDTGQVEFGLLHTDVGSVKITVENGDAASDTTINFRSSLLKMDSSCVNGELGTCINTANLPFELILTAVKENQETKVCELYSPENIAFWSEYITDVKGEGKQVEINSTPIGKTELDAVALPVAFSAGVATVTANYPDAGKVKINVKDVDIPTIKGAVETIVNPIFLKINKVLGQKNSIKIPLVEGSGDGFIRASNPVYNESGIPDAVDTFTVEVQGFIDCKTNTGNDKTSAAAANCGGKIDDTIYVTAPSFANGSNENDIIKFSHQIAFPVSGAQGTLHTPSNKPFKVTLTSAVSPKMAFSEVGSINLRAESENYLILGNKIDLESDTLVGRFYPDYLAFTVGSFSSAPVCSDNDFTYIGEPDALALSYSMKAYSQVSTDETPQVTSNYDHGLGYSVASDFKHFAYAVDGTELTGYKDNSTLNRIFSSKAYDKALWVKGEYNVNTTVQFNLGLRKTVDADNNIVPDGPFENSNKVRYRIELTGTDEEKLQTNSSDTCNEDRCSIGELSDLMYGRLQAGNGYGSEFQPIRTTIQATYYDGSHFVPLTEDSCTTVTMPQVSASPIKNGADEITIETGTTKLKILNSPLIGGVSYFDFSAPKDRGNLNYFIDLSTVAPWLLDNGNAVACSPTETECISGEVSFGLFRGNDRIIYRLQTFD
ncbi:DUF6701 domain-containing protein [Psychromonas ossibalaenae]|uniref:DUF6701 domain-containing protein n=1 Tax=Psychromonas ossibalaenae TaxID=444922 RepID=UPI00036055AB|nr:DUF6701 domain-containing protein [Psychromonas ossibalaenae]